MAAKKKEESDSITSPQGILASLASILVLASAMIDPRISVALAIIGLFLLSFLMKEKKVKQILFSLAALGIAAILILVSNPQGEEAWLAAIIIGLIIWGLIIYNARKKKQEIVSDERVVKISNKAAAYSWWLAYLTIAILLWFDYTKLVSMSVFTFGTLVFMVMLVSQAGIRKYLLSRGEDE
ncbi:MAG: DUF2178 domain-containing protein [Candidatus Micrarchaeia archaeon]